MLRPLEDLPVVNAHPFEYTACIVQTVTQHMQIGLAPRHHPAVVPDDPVTVVEREDGHDAKVPSWWPAGFSRRVGAGVSSSEISQHG